MTCMLTLIHTHLFGVCMQIYIIAVEEEPIPFIYPKLMTHAIMVRILILQ